MKCKYCNADVEQNVRFCTTCGKDLSVFDKCVSCGELIDKGTAVCPYCGTERPEVEEQTSSKKWIWAVVGVLLIGLIGGGYYYLSQNRGSSSRMAEAVDSDSIDLADTISDMNYNIKSVEGVQERLTEIFDNGLKMGEKDAVHKYYSKEFRDLYMKVGQFEKEHPEIEMRFWNGNLWDGAQEAITGYIIKRVYYLSDKTVDADVSTVYDYEEHHAEYVQHYLLVFENNNWFVDDNLTMSLKKGMKEYVNESERTTSNTTISNGTYSMVGNVSKYAIHMSIEINGFDANGYYYYDSQDSGNKVKLSGSIKEDGELTLKKFSKDGEETGYFEGLFNGVEYSGKNVNYKRDEALQFSVTVE